MKSSEILREAARICEGMPDGGLVTWNICVRAVIGQTVYSQDRHPIAKFMRKAGADNPEAYLDDGQRIVAMCLAAAIAESEGD